MLFLHGSWILHVCELQVVAWLSRRDECLKIPGKSLENVLKNILFFFLEKKHLKMLKLRNLISAINLFVLDSSSSR